MSKPRTRALHVSDPLRDALLLYRLRNDVSAAPVLDEADVAAAERELGGKVPDEVLAFFASTSHDLDEMVALTNVAREQGLEWGYAAIGKEDGCLLCIPLGRHEGRVDVGRWVVDDGEPFFDQSLARHLRKRFDLTLPSSSEREAMGAAQLNLAPSVDTPMAAAAPRERRVNHPRFGDGVVVQEIRDGNHKLVIDFECGRKTLLAQYVRDRAPEAA